MSSEAGSLRKEIQGEMSRASGWYLFLGLVLLIGGIATIVFPMAAGTAVTVIIGWMFILGGAAHILNSFMARRAGGFFLRLILGALYVGVGIVILRNPAESLTALTVVLGIAFILHGLAKLIFGQGLSGVPGFGMIVFSGIISIVLGILILVKLPASSEVVVGVLMGIELIQSGVITIWLSRTAKVGAAALSDA